jgi:hypothetical protein
MVQSRRAFGHDLARMPQRTRTFTHSPDGLARLGRGMPRSLRRIAWPLSALHDRAARLPHSGHASRLAPQRYAPCYLMSPLRHGTGPSLRKAHVSRICRDEASYSINPPHRAKRTGKPWKKFFCPARFQNCNEVRCNELRRAATACPAAKGAGLQPKGTW